MTIDPAGLFDWIWICLWIAAVCTTAFPLLYLFSPWHHSQVGRVMMLQSIAFATAMDMTIVFQYWTPDSIYVTFWISAIVLSLIAVATAALTCVLWVTNYKYRQRIKEIINYDYTRQPDPQLPHRGDTPSVGFAVPLAEELRNGDSAGRRFTLLWSGQDLELRWCRAGRWYGRASDDVLRRPR